MHTMLPHYETKASDVLYSSKISDVLFMHTSLHYAGRPITAQSAFNMHAARSYTSVGRGGSAGLLKRATSVAR